MSLSLLLLALLTGCNADPCAGTRDLANSPAGLELTEAEHPAGWGHTDCFECHQRWKIHKNDCIDGAEVHGDEIQADVPTDCAACHGWNGVPDWLDTDVPPDTDTDASAAQ